MNINATTLGFLTAPRTLVLLCVVASIGILLGYTAMVAPAPGYCVETQRFISDDEFIQSAIALREIDWKKRGGREKFKYSGRDFDPQNPNCCRVIRDETFSIINRMFDRQVVEVELNNETSVRNIHDANLNDRLFFDVCKKLKGRIEYDWQAI